jgi:hypothetical protein
VRELLAEMHSEALHGKPTRIVLPAEIIDELEVYCHGEILVELLITRPSFLVVSPPQAQVLRNALKHYSIRDYFHLHHDHRR